MNKPLSIALLVVGIILIAFGLTANHSFSSDVSRAFTGTPTNKALWLLIGGALSAVIGITGLARGSKSS